MSEINYSIRVATPEDAENILTIYAPYVSDTAVSFEYEVPSVEEFRGRIVNILKKYPYLVAVNDSDEIIGYAYCAEFKSREAYRYSVETTIYLRDDVKGKGIGRMLYNRLEEILKKQNVINLNACIATIDVEDEHLTNGSSRFHEKMGYRLVGEFHKCGYKFGRWYNMVWMEKMITEHKNEPGDFVPFSQMMG